MKRHNVQRSRRTGQAIDSSMPWRFFILMAMCAAVLASGFFHAARQHFSTMDLGLKNSKMRKQIEELETERRRLILSKEVSLSPAEIARTAHSMGFRERSAQPRATVIGDVKHVKPKTQSDSIQPVQTSFRQNDNPKTVSDRTKEDKKLIKTIVQQTVTKPDPQSARKTAATKATDINERPRVVNRSDKQPPQTLSKKTQKFR